MRTSERLRVIAPMGPAVFRLFTRFDHRDFNHSVAIVQLAKDMAYLVFRAARPETLDSANGNGGWVGLAWLFSVEEAPL